MKSKNLIFQALITLMIGSSSVLYAQNFNQDPSNPNMDFSAGDFSHWQISWGDRDDTPYDNIGTPPYINAHTVVGIYGTNFDGLTGPGNLPRVPSGLEQVARLGAPTGGGYGFAKAYGMRYSFTVNNDYPILFFQAASVMDKSHDTTRNTHFNYRLLDQNGNMVSQPCDGFRMYPKGGPPASQTTQNIIFTPAFMQTLFPVYGSLLYQPWKSVAMDLSAHVGEIFTIEFEHYDCHTGYHGSYSYLSAAMRSPYDTIYYCKGDTDMVIEGHPRFETYLWSNGETTQNITIQNPFDGMQVTCTVGSYNECEATFTYILKESVVEPDFESVSGGCGEMIFSDNSQTNTGSIVAWEWEFGEAVNSPNDTSELQNPSYVYDETGEYNVTLVAENTLGCRDSITRLIQVPFEGSGDFIYSTACVGSVILFTDNSSGTIVSQEWDFGDGSTSTAVNPQHIYSNTGNFTVTLITENATGCIDTLTRQITVHPLPVSLFQTEGVLCEQTPLSFVDQSTGAVSYSWDFGDGNTSAEQNPAHTYQAAGNYTVMLIAATSEGCEDSVLTTIEITEKPIAQFSASPLSTTLKYPQVTFINESQGAIQWFWEFGDGETAQSENPTHAYTYGGEFQVLLLVADGNGCTDTASVLVTVIEEIFVPNVFTPNGDGINDLFTIELSDNFVGMELLVLNRWGDEVFYTNKMAAGWDGTINGKEAAEGVYFYKATITDKKQDSTEYKGFVTLER